MDREILHFVISNCIYDVLQKNGVGYEDEIPSLEDDIDTVVNAFLPMPRQQSFLDQALGSVYRAPKSKAIVALRKPAIGMEVRECIKVKLKIDK